MTALHNIIPGLYISNKESACDKLLLAQYEIKVVISLGCNTSITSTDIVHLSFPSLLDTPESIILGIFEYTSTLICQSLESNTNVLVHCVYGQSRSAATIIAYLITTGLTITDAMEKMLQCNPGTCINPGFLAQLYFLSVCPRYLESKEYKLLMMSYPLSAQDHTATSSVPSKRKINDAAALDVATVSSTGDQLICRQCKEALAATDSVLAASLDTAAFVKEHVDSFWRGYQPARSKTEGPLTRIPCKSEWWALLPTAWMQQQVALAIGADAAVLDREEDMPSVEPASKMNSDVDIDKVHAEEVRGGALICPGCGAEVGSWRRKQLDLIGVYNPCDLYALSEGAVRMKRYRNVLV